MSPFKKSLLLGVLALGLGACGHKPNDPVSEADNFFRLISEGKTQEAYESASFRFQAEQSMAAFQARVKELGLLGAAPINWNARPFKNGEVALDGELSSSKAKITVRLAKQSGDWRVCAVRVDSPSAITSGIFSLVGQGAEFQDISLLEIPPVVALRNLVVEVLLEFNKATKAKSFAQFYNKVSAKWQSQLTEKKLMDAFGPWVEAGVDIGAVRPEDFVFTQPPRLTPEGLLILKGSMPLQSRHLVFSMQFIYELPKWRLFGMDLSLVE